MPLSYQVSFGNPSCHSAGFSVLPVSFALCRFSWALDYLTTFLSVCQALFSTFSKLFCQPLAFGFPFLKRSTILPYFLSFVKHFFRLFRIFFVRLCLSARSLERSTILPHSYSFVNSFFEVFSKKFWAGAVQDCARCVIIVPVAGCPATCLYYICLYGALSTPFPAFFHILPLYD